MIANFLQNQRLSSVCCRKKITDKNRISISFPSIHFYNLKMSSRKNNNSNSKNSQNNRKSSQKTTTTINEPYAREKKELLLTLNDGIRDERYYGDKRGFQLEDAVVVCWGYRDPKPVKNTDNSETNNNINNRNNRDRARQVKETLKKEGQSVLNQYLNGEKSFVEGEGEGNSTTSSSNAENHHQNDNNKKKFSSTIPFELFQSYFCANKNDDDDDQNSEQPKQHKDNIIDKPAEMTTKRTPQDPHSNQDNGDSSSSSSSLTSSSSIIIGDDSSEIRIIEEQRRNATKALDNNNCNGENTEYDDDDDDEFFASIRRKRNANPALAATVNNQNRIRQREENGGDEKEEGNTFLQEENEEDEEKNLEMPAKFRMICSTKSNIPSCSTSPTSKSQLERNIDLVESRVPIFLRRVQERFQFLTSRSGEDEGDAEDSDEEEEREAMKETLLAKQQYLNRSISSSTSSLDLQACYDRVVVSIQKNKNKNKNQLTSTIISRPVVFKRQLKNSLQDFVRKHKHSSVLLDALSIAVEEGGDQ